MDNYVRAFDLIRERTSHDTGLPPGKLRDWVAAHINDGGEPLCGSFMAMVQDVKRDLGVSVSNGRLGLLAKQLKVARDAIETEHLPDHWDTQTKGLKPGLTALLASGNGAIASGRANLATQATVTQAPAPSADSTAPALAAVPVVDLVQPPQADPVAVLFQSLSNVFAATAAALAGYAEARGARVGTSPSTSMSPASGAPTPLPGFPPLTLMASRAPGVIEENEDRNGRPLPAQTPKPVDFSAVRMQVNPPKSATTYRSFNAQYGLPSATSNGWKMEYASKFEGALGDLSGIFRDSIVQKIVMFSKNQHDSRLKRARVHPAVANQLTKSYGIKGLRLEWLVHSHYRVFLTCDERTKTVLFGGLAKREHIKGLQER